MPVTKMSHGGGRPLSFCYYHRRYKEEASKCSKGELCEFQNLHNQKQFPDLRNNIPHDLRNSLKTDLRVHLRNQGAIPKAKRPKQDDLRSRQSRPRTACEEKSRAEIEDNVVEEDLFERRGNKPIPGSSKAIVDYEHGNGKHIIHISEVEEEDPAESYDLLDELNEEDRIDQPRSPSKGRRHRSREGSLKNTRGQSETPLYYRWRRVEVTEPLTRTILNDRYKGKNHTLPSDKNENPNPRIQEDRTDDKNQGHHSKGKTKHPNDPNNRKGSRSDPNYPENSRGSKIEPNSRKGPRYKPDDRRNSGYASNEDPTSSRRNKRGNKEDPDSDTDDNLTTPRRRNHKQLEDDSDSDDLRPAYKGPKTPREGRQKQRDNGRTANHSGSSSYEEIVSYNITLATSGMPINSRNPDQCPVPQCGANNKPLNSRLDRYRRDSPESHRFLTNCPKLEEMSIVERWEFYKKASCTCTKCFSTQHKFENCPLQLSYPKFCKEQIGNGNVCGGAHHKLLHVDSHI